MKRFRSLIAASLVVSIAGLTVPLPAQAGMLTTEQAVTSPERARINALIEREDLQAKLADYGVQPSEVKARVAAMSDDEVAQLADRIGNERIDSAPAGADAAGALIGAAVLVFIVLLITDILGFTHVFPFTKNIRR